MKLGRLIRVSEQPPYQTMMSNGVEPNLLQAGGSRVNVFASEAKARPGQARNAA
jgi:hypothetical protein